MQRAQRLVLVAFAYVGAHWLGYYFVSRANWVSCVWPASGVGLAAMLLAPRGDRTATFGVLGAATLLSNVVLSGSLPMSLGFTASNLLEFAVGGWLIWRSADTRGRFRRTGEVLRLTLVATVWTAVPAVIGAATGSLARGVPFGRNYVTWWMSDALGILLVTPLVVSWARREPEPREVRATETALLVVAWGLAAWFAFFADLAGPLVPQPYMLLPLLAWTALRLGERAVTLVLLAIAAAAIVSTLHGNVVFGGALESAADRLLTTQVYVAVAAVQSLLLAASTSEAKLLELAAREDEARVRRAEAETRSHAESLRFALEAARMGTWEWDVESNRVTWSQGVERMFGLREGEFPGTLDAYRALIHPDDRERLISSTQATLRGELNEYRIEHRVIWPDGSQHWIEGMGSAHLDHAGRALRMTGTVVEITARKRAEAELSTSEALLKNFIRHTPAAVAMFDTEMHYLQASERWLTDYHLEGQNLIGHSHYEVFPDGPERWKEIHKKALAGAVERCEEDPFQRADGSVEWLQWEVRPWRRADGEIGGIVMFTQVITERKRAEDAQRRSEARFRTLIENTSDLITVLNRDGVIRFQSPSSVRVLGLEPGEVLGRNVIELAHPEDLPLVKETLAASFAANPTTIKIRLRHRDGSYRLLECVGRSVPDEAEDGYTVVNSRDITESTLLQEQLRRTQKLEALGTLAGGIAHDFNNILGAMLAFAELAKLENTDRPELQEQLREIALAGKRATNLVRQILSFSRQQRQERKPIAITAVVHEALKLLRSTLPSSIELVVSLPGALPSVSADATQMHQVVMNLCTNAAQAMGGRGRLTVELDSLRLEAPAAKSPVGLGAGHHVRLRVSDTGSGMDPVTVERIFEPFFTTKQPGEGTGLGLAVVHGIVKDHDGAISVESELGRGTTFTILLPVVAPSETTVERRVTEAPLGRGQKIMFVDDERALCEAARMILRRAGYDAVAHRDSAQAWQDLELDPDAYALVVTDLTMPGMTGLDLAAKIHGLRPELPIILTSGHPGELASETLASLGVRELLQKPVDYQVLTQAVARAIPAGNGAGPGARA